MSNKTKTGPVLGGPMDGKVYSSTQDRTRVVVRRDLPPFQELARFDKEPVTASHFDYIWDGAQWVPDTEHVGDVLRALAAERDALREEVKRLRAALKGIAVTPHRGRDWMQDRARAALGEGGGDG